MSQGVWEGGYKRMCVTWCVSECVIRGCGMQHVPPRRKDEYKEAEPAAMPMACDTADANVK